MTGSGPDPARMLPHAGEMLLVDAVLESDDRRLVCRGHVASTGPLGSPAGAPACVGLEMAAQAGALHQALRQAGGPPVGIGYLVRLRDVSFLAERLPVDAPLHVEVRLQAALPPLLQYEIAIGEGTRTLVRGRLSLYAAGQRSTKQNH